MRPTLPNFIVIGTAKAGTSSLHNYLGQHPQVFTTTQKETNFFVYQMGIPDYRWWGEVPCCLLASTTTTSAYRAHFSHARDELALGESSPLYLYHPDAAKNIKSLIPDVRLIVILRNPVERAFSHYLHLRRDGREPCMHFVDALEQEVQRMLEGWFWDYFYRDMGFYHLQIERYLTHFDRGQIKVFLYEELKSDINKVLEEIFRFLEVDPTFIPDTRIRLNATGIPRYRPLYKMLTSANVVRSSARLVLGKSLRRTIATNLNRVNLMHPRLMPAIRELLVDEYYSSIVALQSLLEIELDDWFSTR